MDTESVGMGREKMLCPQCQTEEKRSKVILYPGQTIPKMNYTDGYWNEDSDSVEFNAEIKLPWYICSIGHVTPRDPNDRCMKIRIGNGRRTKLTCIPR